MKFIPELHEFGEPSTDAGPFMGPHRRKAIKGEIEQMIEEEFDLLEERANGFISDVAARRAERFLEKVLGGDESAAMALLGDCGGNSRYRRLGDDEGKPWCNLIHGNLHETQEIALRRKIVEAHPDLLINERIKDLESVVEGLTEQVRQRDREIERMRGF